MFYIFLAGKSTETGYIRKEYPEIECKDPSTAIPACSKLLDYKIPDFKNYPQLSLTDGIRTALVDTSRLSSGGEKCVKTGTKFICEIVYMYRCGDENVEIILEKLEDTFNEGKKDCSSLNKTIRDSFFNYNLSSLSSKQKISRKTFMCSAFPVLENDPYSCKTNYKVYGGDEKELKTLGDILVENHKSLEKSDISDAECKKNLADVLCKVIIPACSIDRTKLVYLLSRQDCRKIVGCVNKTGDANMIRQVHYVCKNLPDANTAKKYSMENVCDNKAANHALAFSTILFMATLVAQCFP